MTTPDCEHHNLRIGSISDSNHAGVRTVHMICKDCGFEFDMLTNRSTEEIDAELAAADPADVPA